MKKPEYAEDFQKALDISREQQLPEIGARALEGLGIASEWGGDPVEAEKWFTKALEARIALSGDTHPKVSDLLNNLGDVAYFRGDNQRAEAIYQRLLAIDRRVLGPNHPDLAVTMVNIGRLRLERLVGRAQRLVAQRLGQIVLAILQAHGQRHVGHPRLLHPERPANVGPTPASGSRTESRDVAVQASTLDRHLLLTCGRNFGG